MNKLLPPNISLYITYHCQLKCKHCFLTISEKLNKHRLNYNDIEKIVHDAVNNNVFSMIIAGGDPSLSPDFYKTIKLLNY